MAYFKSRFASLYARLGGPPHLLWSASFRHNFEASNMASASARNSAKLVQYEYQECEFTSRVGSRTSDMIIAKLRNQRSDCEETLYVRSRFVGDRCPLPFLLRDFVAYGGVFPVQPLRCQRCSSSLAEQALADEYAGGCSAQTYFEMFVFPHPRSNAYELHLTRFLLLGYHRAAEESHRTGRRRATNSRRRRRHRKHVLGQNMCKRYGRWALTLTKESTQHTSMYFYARR